LQWVPLQAFKREYELRSGEETLATLRWKTPFGSIALAEAADETCSFKRGGFFRPKITVRRPGSDENVAILHAGWGGEGSLDFANGSWYQWRNNNFWHSEWAFFNKMGELLVQFKPEPAFLQHAASVHIETRAMSLPDLPLVMLGWYLMVLMSKIPPRRTP
jgi:hypothetical protein